MINKKEILIASRNSIVVPTHKIINAKTLEIVHYKNLGIEIINEWFIFLIMVSIYF